jgi:2-polyprenyl-6-methoxyphenol hydroxylase-like FAD-dependent oxidoreductase
VSWIVSGRGVRVALAPCGGGDVFWLATARQDLVGALGPGARRVKEQLAALLASAPPALRDLVAATPTDEIFATAVRDRRPASRWGRGAVTLIGDAAHPATPDLGQGACQALESAAALGRSFARHCRILPRDAAAALRAYEARRQTRAALVTQLSWATAVEGMRDDPIFCWLRDALTGAFVSSVGRVAIRHLACHRG